MDPRLIFGVLVVLSNFYQGDADGSICSTVAGSGCMNGGELLCSYVCVNTNQPSHFECTCDCPDNFFGPMCESEESCSGYNVVPSPATTPPPPPPVTAAPADVCGISKYHTTSRVGVSANVESTRNEHGRPDGRPGERPNSPAKKQASGGNPGGLENEERVKRSAGDPVKPQPGPGESERIVGGSNARPYEFPWVISLQIYTSTGWRHTCGGSIISERWILTAAHCLNPSYSPSAYRVVAGVYDISALAVEPDVQIRDIQYFVLHEHYSRAYIVNDTAVIYLTSPLEFNENVRKICIPAWNDDYTGHDCLVAGWGALNSYIPGDPQVSPGRLMWTTLPVVNQQTCADFFTLNQVSIPITEEMLCAGEINGHDTSTCQGDSGGPLVCQEPGSNQFYQVGVVSWGLGCADGFPAVFARVQHFLDWIEEKTGIVLN